MLKSALDNSRVFESLDKKDLYSSIAKISLQFESGWHEAHFLNLGFEPEKLKSIVLAGMGGSNMAGKVIHSLSPFLLNIPFEVAANYRLPPYVKKSTLVILSSYSGNTQETLSCALDAKNRGAKIVCIASGGQLEKMAKENHWPLIKLDPALNTSKIPRMGLFLSLGASLGLIERFKPDLTPINPKQISSLISRTLDPIGKDIKTKENPAKALAEKYKGQGLIILGANHLYGVADTVKNFFNETSKTFSVSLSIPDMNHHFLDGLVYPEKLKDSVSFLIFNSSLYPQVIQRRVELIKDILLKQKYKLSIIRPESSGPTEQVLESLVFCTLLSYYLGIANQVDPSATPWVDYLKNHL
ncbi:MAG: Bifunctional phosphoglucose/phosphomannose isomerase [Candidatus Collierbacteria bacterium GW2011_GWF2_44_15]|nr:MAG: Bifunctional phosphoglucose/phosphomannose isomerase [Candidatus Collierbacteria bacterium GW2011_GWF1_44_12]KKT45420.1 MAG: Bifunctional phosphoglucose/phosphomannose isomerase [Candidatus Collierbacteria bacterium GW2011_GWF2_44_15]KKU28909.1 MAG: Bifunctional phosphoglucose/phosphomannose isomerase [Candidatus Collierbacteria bacterium GW2011_GWE1_46_18]